MAPDRRGESALIGHSMLSNHGWKARHIAYITYDRVEKRKEYSVAILGYRVIIREV